MDNPRRRRGRRRRSHSGRRSHRRNPSGIVGDVFDNLVDAFWNVVGIAATAFVGRFLPNEIRSNPYLSPAAKGLEGMLVVSMRDQLPGGASVADRIASGAWIAAAIELIKNVGGASVPGAGYFPTLAGGGADRRRFAPGGRMPTGPMGRPGRPADIKL